MDEMSFWDHLDALRSVLFKSAAAIFVFAIAAFIYMPYLFDNVILYPCSSDFPLYHWIYDFNELIKNHTKLDMLPNFGGDMDLKLISNKLASQFFIHMKLSLWIGIMFSFPFIIYQLWSFVSPALYDNEKKNVRWAFLFGNIMFFLGVLVGYFIVFPMTLRFLATYQLTTNQILENWITLDSYMSNFLMLVLIMGIVFELPLLCWMLSGIGVLKRSFFSKYRRYAVVGILVAAAIITPSSDPFTLMVVFIPLYLLYEFSALFVKKGDPEEDEDAKENVKQIKENN